MKAVRYHGANQALTYEDVSVPTLTDENGVLVQVHAAALCHTELHFCSGTLDLGVKPMTLGHEAVGVITQVGANVPASRIGERVIVYYYLGCGKCRWCQKGDEQLCGSLRAQYGFVSDGGLAEYLVTTSRNAVLLPDALDFVQAAPIGCGVTTAVHASKLGRPQPEAWSLVYGVNGVGFGLVQLLSKKYNNKVICVGRSQEKLDMAKELGAHAVIDASEGNANVAATVRELTGGDGVDTIFECVGSRETMDSCVGWGGALGKRGRMVLIGYHAGSEHDFRCHPIPLIVYEQQIIGSVGATLEDLKDAVDMVADGTIKTIVDSSIPLEDFQSGLDKIKACKCVGKIVCLPAQS